jgi:chemotaxis protein CheX
MDVSCINAIVQGAQKVINNLFGETPKLGQVFAKSMPYSASPITVSIFLVGAIQGEVVFNMDDVMGCHIASKMMGGMPVPALDEMSISAVSELANIISGNVATIFAGREMLVDISPPTFRKNAAHADFPYAAKIAKAICVPLQFSTGHIFEVDVLIP